jgi:hypothetical protein
MSKTPQEDYREKVDLLAFFGAVKGSVNEINNKVLEGHNVRVNNVDVQKLALDHDKSMGVQPILQQPAAIVSAPVTPEIQVESQQQSDTDQLLLPFDKKYNLNDIFSRRDDMYRALLKLESEISSLKEIVEDKKKEL